MCPIIYLGCVFVNLNPDQESFSDVIYAATSYKATLCFMRRLYSIVAEIHEQIFQDRCSKLYKYRRKVNQTRGRGE